MNKVSVIIPCYNVEKYITKCMDSVVNQTYKNIEIICIDDGSTDDTRKIIESYLKSDKRIKIITQNNSGLSSARNEGLRVSNGDYTVFLDGDDWIELDTIELAINKIIELKVDIVFWSYFQEYGENLQREKYIFGKHDILLKNKDYKAMYRRFFGLTDAELSNPAHADSIVTVWGKLYKSSLLENSKFIDTKEIGTEDALFNIYVLKNAKSAFYISKCLNHYRKNNVNSLTKTFKPELYLQWNNLFDYMSNFIQKHNLQENYVPALNNRICLSIIGLGLNELNNPNGFMERLHNLKTILNSDRYKGAYKNLELKYFPIHWKVFFLFAKNRMVLFLYIMLYIINKIK